MLPELLLTKYPKETIEVCQRDTSCPRFVAVPFIVSKMWEEQRQPFQMISAHDGIVTATQKAHNSFSL